ncbi:hypothetical protein EDF60_2322 [Leucobacter luti]|uniref:hypothetical protein n=1 Tax=Leucobacter luti TaxID=340320 RepID=UPI001046C6E6|nr:hypothetical protein [Leucobacter luti]MCW2289304.1 hypothetical protein [Leucobacter luti]TCK39866.1 hypothetical protein EDF60_2322 [Leucobacter luti]
MIPERERAPGDDAGGTAEGAEISGARAGSTNRRRALAAWFVASAFLGLAVCWIGLGATQHSPGYSWLMWLYGMWLACLLLAPLAGVGAAIGHSVGSRAIRTWGIVGLVVCLPGFFLSFTLLGNL